MTRTRLSISVLAIALAASPAASIAAPTSAAATGTAEAVRMRIDRNHSTVGFRVPILAGMSTVTGKFTDFEIEFDYDAATPSNSTVSVTIQVASIDTGIDRRDEHLRTADFFDVENEPTMTFVSNRIDVEGDHGLAQGTLTMRGTSRAVTLDLQLMPMGEGGIGVKATATIDRTDYGVSYQRDNPLFIGDEITIELFILASLPQEEEGP